MITYTKNEVLLRIKDVSLHFGNKVVLDGVNAEVHNITRDGIEQGQVVCFLGPSGIGKTRLSRLIAGLDKPTAGTISLVGNQPTSAGLVGLVQQSYPLFGYMTAKENLIVAAKMGGKQFPKRPKGENGVEIRAYTEALSISDETLKLYPKQLSGGQRQRVAIIRQLLCSKHFIILDEPFSGLDIKAKQQACELIRTVSQMDTLNTIIIVTHDVTEGMSVADTVWLMGLDGVSPGAHIVRQYDLAAEGFAWRPDIQHDAQFLDLVRSVKDDFLKVAP